jgi:hypothetical protein
VKSIELKQLMDAITGMKNGEHGSLGIIPRHLQKKSLTYLWDNYNPFFIQSDDGNKNSLDRNDNFQFEIKVDEVSVAKSEFSGNYFPPKVRYSVDVREIIPEIMSEIRYYLSLDKLNVSKDTKAWVESQKEFLIK